MIDILLFKLEEKFIQLINSLISHQMILRLIDYQNQFIYFSSFLIQFLFYYLKFFIIFQSPFYFFQKLIFLNYKLIILLNQLN